MSDINNNLDFLNDDDGLGDEGVGGGQFKTVSLFNPDLKYRGKTIIGPTGGYALLNETGNAPDIGPAIDLAYSDGKTKKNRIAQTLDIAIIGASGQSLNGKTQYMPYVAVAGKDDQGNGYFLPAPEWMGPESFPVDAEGKATGKSLTAFDLFIVLKADPARNLYRLTVKNHDAARKMPALLTEAMGLAETTKSGLGVKNLRVFGNWLRLGVSEAFLSGKAPNQALVVSPALALPDGVYVPDLFVGRDDYQVFVQHRIMLDEYLTGDPYLLSLSRNNKGLRAALPEPVKARMIAAQQRGPAALPAPMVTPQAVDAVLTGTTI